MLYLYPKEQQKKNTNTDKTPIVEKYRKRNEKRMLNSASQTTNLLLLKK